jgi:SAM-dependent methyltransferase
MNNYEFCVHFARTAAIGHPDFSVLDFGCGAATVVRLLTDAGIEAVGCDTFYEGGDLSNDIPEAIGNRVHRMTDGRIPFADATFDLVISNQVMEHVADLDAALAEIARVLKPGGTCLSLFPHREVWREGHCNIPFLHRFPKGRLRVFYAAALYPIGSFREGSSRMQWARNFADWIDRWCYYRTYSEIAATFARHLSKPQHIEADWIVKRRSEFRYLPPFLRTLISRKAAGLVFVTTATIG